MSTDDVIYRHATAAHDPRGLGTLGSRGAETAETRVCADSINFKSTCPSDPRGFTDRCQTAALEAHREWLQEIQVGELAGAGRAQCRAPSREKVEDLPDLKMLFLLSVRTV